MPTQAIRPPTVAGHYYASDPDQLEADIRRYLNSATAPQDCEDAPLVKAVIAPHAGLSYSGVVAAAAYLHLACSDVPVKRFVLLGPAHHVTVDGLAISGAAAFDTPFGPVPVDERMRAAALALPGVAVNVAAHAAEHSLEVQLPLLQTLFLDFAIVPLLVGSAPAGQVAAVIEALWDGPETRFIISSDLSHGADYAAARRRDEETAAAIVALRPEALREDSACGRAAIAGLLLAAQRRGLAAELVDLRSSGDAGGARESVVGYGAFLFTCDAPDAF